MATKKTIRRVRSKCSRGTQRVNGKCKTMKKRCKPGYHRPSPTKRCTKK